MGFVSFVVLAAHADGTPAAEAVQSSAVAVIVSQTAATDLAASAGELAAIVKRFDY